MCLLIPLFERLLALATLTPRWVRHNPLCLSDRLQGETRGPCTFTRLLVVMRLRLSQLTHVTSHIMRRELVVIEVVRLSLLLESSLWEIEAVRVIAQALRRALINTAEVLADFDIVQWVISRAHQVLGLLPVGEREEVGLGIETAIWNGLVTLLARGIFDGRTRLLVVRARSPYRITSLHIALVDKVGLVAAHGLVLRLRTKL